MTVYCWRFKKQWISWVYKLHMTTIQVRPPWCFTDKHVKQKPVSPTLFYPFTHESEHLKWIQHFDVRVILNLTQHNRMLDFFLHHSLSNFCFSEIVCSSFSRCLEKNAELIYFFIVKVSPPPQKKTHTHTEQPPNKQKTNTMSLYDNKNKHSADSCSNSPMTLKRGQGH